MAKWDPVCAEAAAAHTEEVAQRCEAQIRWCIACSKIYRETVPGAEDRARRGGSRHVLEATDAVSAAFAWGGRGRTAILNFADYKEPGGKYLEGATAQEEQLCAESFLYNVLRAFSDYYSYNGQHKDRGLYTDAAIYTPNVLFERDGASAYFDVLSCAAPNYRTGARYGTVTQEENDAAQTSRIRFILDILAVNEVDVAILGAFGCGVFRQDPRQTARLFRDLAGQTAWRKETQLVYAVPNTGKGANYQAFQTVFAPQER